MNISVSDKKTIEITVENTAGYPCVKINSLGNIVLFTAPGVGTSLNTTGRGASLLGFHQSAWPEDEFAVFEGKIEISN